MDTLTRLALEAGRGDGDGDGDGDALAAFVRASQAEVWRFCSHLVDRDSADDLTQEVYLRAIRGLPRFRAESSARTWLLTIARRVCADAVRGAVRRRTLVDRLVARRVLAASPDRVSPPPDGHLALEDLVARLDPDQRTAFVLTQVLGLAYDEAAEVCDCPVGTIRSRVARARGKLVEALSPTRHQRHSAG
ncbi:MAG: sigma-70 family RNA polymerase sigma factor [Acidimicrobiales bacterium]